MMNLQQTQLLSELEKAAERADLLITRINRQLERITSVPEQFSLQVFVECESIVRRHLEIATRTASDLRRLPFSRWEEARHHLIPVIRRSTLAIQLQVTRLSEMLEMLL